MTRRNPTTVTRGKSLLAEDEIQLNKKKYVVRFSPKHALHIWENYESVTHRIKHTEILSMIKKSPLFIQDGKFYVILGKHRNKIYSTIVELKDDRIEVRTSYKCSNPDHINRYNDVN